jgi:hypothetical protein
VALLGPCFKTGGAVAVPCCVVLCCVGWLGRCCVSASLRLAVLGFSRALTLCFAIGLGGVRFLGWTAPPVRGAVPSTATLMMLCCVVLVVGLAPRALTGVGRSSIRNV